MHNQLHGFTYFVPIAVLLHLEDASHDRQQVIFQHCYVAVNYKVEVFDEIFGHIVCLLQLDLPIIISWLLLGKSNVLLDYRELECFH